jgi:hypothetical protein
MVYPHNFFYKLLYIFNKVICYHICSGKIFIISLFCHYADKPYYSLVFSSSSSSSSVAIVGGVIGGWDTPF